MNVTTTWFCIQNATKPKKEVEVIIVGSSGLIVKTTIKPQ